jgi:hypothetical protein
VSSHDGSRIEAAEAGVRTEHEERDEHGGAHQHVTATGSVSPAHEAHDDDHGSHGGHGADPNEGVLRGEAPTPAWVMTATAVAFVTLALCVLLAVKIG